MQEIFIRNIEDIFISTPKKQYNLGSIVKIFNSKNEMIQGFVYVKAIDDVKKYSPHFLDKRFLIGGKLCVKLPFQTSLFQMQYNLPKNKTLCTAQANFKKNNYGFVSVFGETSIRVKK